jgi:PPOX class probable F420-dependent enzyme
MSYQCTELSQTQVEAFLQAPRFAVVGTNRVDGPPQLTPVWYLYENNQIYVSIYLNSAKYRNLRRDPRIGVCIAGEHPDARAVMIYGTVELIQEDSTWFNEICWRLVRRYYDSDEEAQSYLDSEAGGGDSVLAVVTPEKIIAEDYN